MAAWSAIDQNWLRSLHKDTEWYWNGMKWHAIVSHEGNSVCVNIRQTLYRPRLYLEHLDLTTSACSCLSVASPPWFCRTLPGAFGPRMNSLKFKKGYDVLLTRKRSKCCFKVKDSDDHCQFVTFAFGGHHIQLTVSSRSLHIFGDICTICQ